MHEHECVVILDLVVLDAVLLFGIFLVTFVAAFLLFRR